MAFSSRRPESSIDFKNRRLSRVNYVLPPPVQSGWRPSADMGEPTVSIILPTHSERSFVRDCLDSLAGQDYPSIVEILVVDGGSTDGTRSIVEQYGAPVRLIDNPRVTAAAAMNIGIAAAAGEVVVRADAHALYSPDYVSRCIHTLLETGAENVGGPMRPVGTTKFGRAVAAVTTIQEGIGNGAFHYATIRQDVDTVFLGCWRTSALRSLDGFDETSLQWAAEDHELNYRITQGGGRIVLDPSIRSVYFPRDGMRGLARQYHNYGIGKASTLHKHGRLPTLRPLAPAALVGLSAVGAIFGRGTSRIIFPALHSLFCARTALKAGRAPGVSRPNAGAALSVMHWSYGTGFFRGLGRAALGRPFTNRPRGHR